jgi:hypothetical protein
MLHAVRAALIVADAAGSGLPRVNYTIAQWIKEQLDENALCDVGTVNQLIEARIGAIESGGREFSWNAFQNDCETLPDRSLLLAPCGAGKTLAAWRWILGRLKSRGHVGRIIFLYPTRATATEGFKDYRRRTGAVRLGMVTPILDCLHYNTGRSESSPPRSISSSHFSAIPTAQCVCCRCCPTA